MSTTARFRVETHVYSAGDHVYLRPTRWLANTDQEERLHNFDARWVILEQLEHRGWPHYRLMAPNGEEWQASQLELSKVPFTNFRRR